jgi:hypothetical protein
LYFYERANPSKDGDAKPEGLNLTVWQPVTEQDIEQQDRDTLDTESEFGSKIE